MKLRQLFEQQRKVAVAAFGRMNPPTIGHEKLVDKLKSIDGDHYLFLSQTQKPKDNPLPFDVKLEFAKKFFPNVNVGHPTVRTPIQMLQMLEQLGYTDIVYVAGSDRVESFEKLFNDYNGKEYNFNSIQVVSAGERDPDADGAEGMSASKMRAAAASGDYESFAMGAPDPRLAKKMYDAVRTGMGVKDKDAVSAEGVEEDQLDEASARDILLSLLDKFYADMKLPPREGAHTGELDIKGPSARVWTRGDGTRYREPGRIQASYWADDKKQAEKAASKFWPWLLKQPGVKSIGQVSGEFGSSPMKDAVSYKGLYFSGGSNGVEFGSMSRYKNPRSVWRQKKDEGVAESGFFNPANPISPLNPISPTSPMNPASPVYYGNATGTVSPADLKILMNVLTGLVTGMAALGAKVAADKFMSKAKSIAKGKLSVDEQELKTIQGQIKSIYKMLDKAKRPETKQKYEDMLKDAYKTLDEIKSRAEMKAKGTIGEQGVAEAEKKPHPKTWHDVDPKLGKQVDKMSQKEKVAKGYAHPDTLKKKGVAEGVEIVDQDSDLDQQVFTLNVDGKTVSFTYWDYENNFQNPDIKDIYQQAQEQLGKKLSSEQIKAVARSVFKSFKSDVAEGMFGLSAKEKGKIQYVTAKISDIPGNWDHKNQQYTEQGLKDLKSVMKNEKYLKYALSLTADDYEAEGNNQHISPSGVKTNMDPSDDDYDINYGKNGLVAKFRKSQGLDVKTGSKKTKEAAYEGNIGIMELFKFFSKAEKEDPKLVARVKEMIKQRRDKEVWRIIQDYTGTQLTGKEFEGSIKEAIFKEANYGKYWCSTDKKWKFRKGPKQSRSS